MNLVKSIGCTFLIILLIASTTTAAQNRQKILCLHSYDPSYEWQKNMDAAIDRTLLNANAEMAVYHEYMDVLRAPYPSFQVVLLNYLQNKYRNTPFDIILVSDNNALNFMLNYRDQVFGQVPVVFMGINNYSTDMLQNQRRYTGVAENIDIAETLKTTIRFMPHIRNLLVFGSWNTTYYENVSLLNRAVTENNLSLKIQLFENDPISRIVHQAAALKKDDLVIFLSAVLGDDGKVMPITQSLQMISRASTVPVLNFWDFSLGKGALGGKLVSSQSQGEAAAHIALRILNGEPIENIPVLDKSPNRYMFDYAQLQRFSIAMDALPENSLIVNQPESFYYRNKRVVITGIASFCLLMAIIGFLLTSIVRQKKTERLLRQSETKFFLAFQTSPYAIIITHPHDGRFIDVNDAFTWITGYSRDEAIATSSIGLQLWADENDRNSVISDLLAHGSVSAREMRFRKKNAEIITCIFSAKIIVFNNEQCIFSSINDITAQKRYEAEISRDITKRKQAEKALLESEEQFRALSEATFEAIFLSEKGICFGQNKTAEKLFGYALSEAIGRPGTDWIVPEDRQTVMDNILSGYEEPYEISALRKDGSTFYAEIQGKMMHYQQRLVRVTALRDITNRKKAEEELVKSEEQHRRLLQHLQIGIVVHMPDTSIRFCNTEALRILGLFNCQIQGATAFDPEWQFFREDGSSMPSAEYPVNRVLDSLQPISEYVVGVNAAGDRKWGLVNAYPEFDAAHRLHSVVVTFIDITKRKHASELLRESEEKYRLLFENSVEGIFQTSPDGQFLSANPFLARLLGYDTPEELMETITNIGRQHYADPGDRKIFQSILETEGIIRNFETRLIRKDGTVIWVALNARAIKNDTGSIRHYEGTLIDLTDRKQAEEEKVKLETQLQQAQKIESIGSLAGGIAHDLNNILFPIIGFSEILLDEITPDNPAHRKIKQIHKSAQRGSDLVKQILAFSRQLNPQKLPIRIQSILKEVLKLARTTIPMNIEIISNSDVDCGLVSGDSTQIHQIAMNLIINAYHAVEKTGGSIRVGLKETLFSNDGFSNQSMPSGRYACISISDTGTGIDPTLIHKIFDPYFTTKEQGKGTGLGLSVVHGIVKEHGGEIRVHSTVGKGTEFDVYLPILEDAKDILAVTTTIKYPTGTERILLVDDEEPIVSMEQMMLERLGYQVTARTSSPEALAAFKANPLNFDLVISDRSMPNMTGDQLARELMSVKPAIPIIICTGFSDETYEQLAKSIGIKGFLMKPVATGDMAKMVRNVLDGCKPEPF
ncbi:MAG: ABC transporter substrate binding protein [Desulfatirhabdiaceae bacterium]